MALKVPEKIKTLSRIPRDETIIENGIGVVAGRREKREVKEFFMIKKGAAHAPDVIYYFTLCYSEQDAKRRYESYKNYEFIRPYFTGESDDRAYVVRYVVQDRRGDTGGFFCETEPYLLSYAAFRLRNLFVEIQVHDRDDNPDALTKAVEYLTDLLTWEWGQSPLEGKPKDH